jgi:hypothetical protein
MLDRRGTGTMQRRQRWLVSLGIIGFVVLSACTTIVPPPELVASNDHARIVGWYAEEAERLRAHTEQLQEMAKQYEYVRYSTVVGLGRHEMVDQLNMVIDNYTSMAKEADRLAEAHRAMVPE